VWNLLFVYSCHYLRSSYCKGYQSCRAAAVLLCSLPDRCEVRMRHCFLRCQTILRLSVEFRNARSKMTDLMIVAKQLVQEVNRIVAYEPLVFRIDE